MFRRCARLLDGFKASANIRDQIRYHVLIGLSGDFVEISRRHPDRREKECTAEVETYVNFIRSCEDLSVSALDDAPFAVPDTEALFLREKWLSGDVDGAVERAVRFMSPYKCPNKEPSNVLEYLDVIWVPPVIRNPPAVSEPLAKTPSEREVLTALLSSWDGQTYRNFLETFKNVKWEGIPPYCCAMVALAAVVAVREDGLGNPETSGPPAISSTVCGSIESARRRTPSTANSPPGSSTTSSSPPTSTTCSQNAPPAWRFSRN